MSPERAIAHYRLSSKLGEGGMGEVFRATDTKLNREVAIKVLPDVVAADADRLARFQREAQVLASLNHPNIAAIYGVEDRAIVMELVEGAEPRGPMSADEALSVVEQLIDALEYAHDRGVIHRDLKPANLKITSDGRLKVLDFGLAKALSNDAPATDPANSPTMTMRATMAGVIMGTAAYMSPEQARGHAVDKRADIWSFGAVVYELLTGKQCFEGATVSDTLAAVLRHDPDLSIVPARFQKLLSLCLTRDPKQRLRDISGARLLLDPVGEVKTARTARWPWVVAALAIVIAAASYWRRPAVAEAIPMRLSVDLGPEAEFDARTVMVLSADGKRIVYTAKTPDGHRVLATRLWGEAKPELLRGTEGAVDPFVSPDGEWIGFFADSKLKKVPVHGGAPVDLAQATPNPRGAAWGEDGSIVFAMTPASGFSRVSAAGGKLESLTTPASRGQATHRWPQFLPGGRKLLFTAHTSTNGLNSAEIDVLDVASGVWQTVQHGGYFGRYLLSGHLVYVHDGTLFAVRFDPGSARTLGVPVPILDDVAANYITATGRFDFTPSGTFAYISGRPDDVRVKPAWIDSSGKIADAPAGAHRVSPDGRLIVGTRGSIGQMNVTVWDLQREVMTSITSDSHDNNDPMFAPDGKHVIYASYDSKSRAIWWARADAGGEPRKLLESDRPLFPYSMSSDGRFLAYGLASMENAEDLWVVPLDPTDADNPKPGKPELFLGTSASERSPVFSPDGRWVGYASSDAGPSEVYVRPFHGGAGRWQVSSGDGVEMRWSRTSRQILYITSAGQIRVLDYEVHGDTFVPGKSRPWTNTRATSNMGRAGFDLAPDGKRVLTSINPDQADGRGSSLHIMLLLNFFDELKRRLP